MMKKLLTVLLIEDSLDFVELVQRWLSSQKEIEFVMIWANSLMAGINRLEKGGVDAILLDLGLPGSQGMKTFADAKLHAASVPIVILSGSDTESLALEMVQEGAQDYIIKNTCNSAILVKAVQYAVGRSTRKLSEDAVSCQGTVIGIIGAKGGVGATTVALNMASLLAGRGSVILAEMHPNLGTLAPYLQPQSLTRNLSHLLDPECSAPSLAEVASTLWNYRNIPGLSILFGPQTYTECAEIEPERAKTIIQSLAGLAEYVVVDLPASLSEANRVVLEHSTSMVLVVERDPVCVRSAALMARGIETWNAAPRPVGAVIVNRSAFGRPMPLAEIDTLLGCKVLRVIPPAADLCLSALSSGVPVVVLDPDSLVAGSLKDLSEILAPLGTTAPPRTQKAPTPAWA
jgi:MinD-like ATPase involved in chromosome partitioning or flagellar assembly/CheY-like chemotaxis protein